MARYHGKAGKVTIGATIVTEVGDWSFDLDNPAVDASYMGNASRNVLQGQYGASGSFTCNYDPGDAQQEALITAALMAATAVTLKLYPLGSTTGNKYWQFSAFITKAGEKGSVGGKITRDFSFTSDGDISRNTA
ncbi:MAG: hypothetical protein U1E23_14740 [Reyranellaceae bacterium]